VSAQEGTVATTRGRRKAKADPEYFVVAGTSTRASLDPESEDFATWVDFEPGDIVPRGNVPAHAAVDEWLASGNWVEASRADELTVDEWALWFHGGGPAFEAEARR
jgi:hypothetical protein